MQNKRAIEYRRFSSDKQSNFSLERQAGVNQSWAAANGVTIVDVFSDDGESARTFDRPDVQRLFSFIKKNHRTITYLLVAELTRFSRDLDGAIKMIKIIQQDYNIKIVSCSTGRICDIFESNSFILTSLEFTFGNAENLKRQRDITGGIYTAKKMGEYINPKAPYGYKKNGTEKKQLVIVPEAAAIVQFIYSSYLKGVPSKTIFSEAKKMGLQRTGKSFLADMLGNPVYMAMQNVKPYLDQPGGMFPGNWPPIIDNITWYQVQEKLTGGKRRGIAIDENFPLRGVLNCYCGKKMTGAPSKGRNGYHNYYKCNYGGSHNNVSATFAHNQLNDALQYMSLPQSMVQDIQATSAQMLQDQLQENKRELTRLRHKLTDTNGLLHSLEDKFIADLVSIETYQRLQPQYMQQRQELITGIDELSKADCNTFELLQSNLQLLTDLPALYNTGSLLDKQDLLYHWFDNKLYYKDRVYRTAYMMELFSHSELILREKQLLIVEKKPGLLKKPGYVEMNVPLSNRIIKLLTTIEAINKAS